mmetsp:Transcript_52064/g.167875  ORF Transcript_52064/g.167875 Transcript_52064/m.167875 type:complete len:340 (+) Transcript_52064:86-1105(+)
MIGNGAAAARVPFAGRRRSTSYIAPQSPPSSSPLLPPPPPYTSSASHGAGIGRLPFCASCSSSLGAACMHSSSGTIASEFRASGSRNQRPSRCSCPTAAATNLPLRARAIPFTNPVRGTEWMGERERPASSACQKRRAPSHEPERTTSECGGAASAVIQQGAPPVRAPPSPCAVGSVARGRLRIDDQRERVPSWAPATKLVGESMATASSGELPPPNTSCVSSSTFHSRSVRSSAAETSDCSPTASRAVMPSWCPKSVSTKPRCATFHTRTHRSDEPEYASAAGASRRSARLVTRLRWPPRHLTTPFVRKSQTSTRASPPPVSSVRPSSAAATASTSRE